MRIILTTQKQLSLDRQMEPFWAILLAAKLWKWNKLNQNKTLEMEPKRTKSHNSNRVHEFFQHFFPSFSLLITQFQKREIKLYHEKWENSY